MNLAIFAQDADDLSSDVAENKALVLLQVETVGKDGGKRTSFTHMKGCGLKCQGSLCGDADASKSSWATYVSLSECR